MHFNTVHLEEMGMVLCRTLLDYINPTNTFAMDVMRDLESLHRASAQPFETCQPIAALTPPV